MPKLLAVLIIPIVGFAFFTLQRPNEAKKQSDKWLADSHRVSAAVRQANAGNDLVACDLYKSILKDGVNIDTDSANVLERACR